MERLTERDSNGTNFLACREGCNGGPACFECEQKAIDRLAAYEDTGLEPEEVKALVQIPNDPLTLEELREMDGEPVWVVTGSVINAGRGCWDICDWWDKNTVMFPYSGEQPRVDDYGITWTAYRRKPEGEEKNADRFG